MVRILKSILQHQKRLSSRLEYCIEFATRSADGSVLPDGGDETCGERIVRETQKQAALPDTCVGFDEADKISILKS